MGKLKTVIIFVVFVIILVSIYAVINFRSGVYQPIAFNHLLHTEDIGLECIECHHYYREHSASGLPDGETCQGCHEDAMTDSREEAKLITMLEAGEEIYFQKLLNLEDHVYYSHQMHVVVAEIQCEKCHGGIAKTTSPPRRPLVNVDMDYCMGCHDDLGVTNDCISCHR
jgi:predicted CXXCH cytochrome family protein